MIRPLLFLDVDGVLISGRWIKVLPERFRGGAIRKLDPAAVERLNRIVRETNADIVVSSMWRMMGLQACRQVLRDQGVRARLIGVTPVLSRERGYEIAAWLAEHGGSGQPFAILDDSSDMVHLMPRLIRTTFEEGLLDAHVDRAIEMLRKAS